LLARFEAANAALKKGGVFAVHKTRAAREGPIRKNDSVLSGDSF
jgi:hypothetical protein